MYNIFGLLIGVPDYSISSGIYRALKKNSYNLYTICNKMSNDIISSTNVQYI